MKCVRLPKDLLHIILIYDRKYVDIIHKHDARYDMIVPVINKNNNEINRRYDFYRRMNVC